MPEWESLGLKSRVAGAIVDIESKLERCPIPKKLRFALPEASKYCCIASLDAVGDSGLPEADVQSDRTACIVGTGIGSVGSIYAGGGRQLAQDSWTQLFDQLCVFHLFPQHRHGV